MQQKVTWAVYQHSLTTLLIHPNNINVVLLLLSHHCCSGFWACPSYTKQQLHCPDALSSLWGLGMRLILPTSLQYISNMHVVALITCTDVPGKVVQATDVDKLHLTNLQDTVETSIQLLSA